ncbi:MAG TPA: GAF domain-containing protein [Mycobacteriales bacterium]
MTNGEERHPAQRPPPMAFADVPRLELDQLLTQLVDRAQDVLATQGRLRGLLAANRMVGSDLTVPAVLRHIVESSCELVRARYGALAVWAPDGALLEFVHHGLDPQTVAAIGTLPAGRGLLGRLPGAAAPVRLDDVTSDPRFTGFPAHHPRMTSFLGVPLSVRGEVFGTLYLADAEAGRFTAEDEELVLSLAAAAGVTVENARLLEQARRRETWLQASMEITRQLLADEGEEPLEVIARRARAVADADSVTVVLPTPTGDRLMVEVATGARADDLTGYAYPLDGTLARVTFASGQPVLVGDASDGPHHIHLSDFLDVGPVMVLPLTGTQRPRGALVIGRLRGRARFDEVDLAMATTFANHAAIALELADARDDRQRVALLEDRDRIARDLHDHVIQRLFAAGLTLQSVGTDERIERVVGDIDETIRQIRTSIFQLRGPLGPRSAGVRSRVLDVVAGVRPALGFDPRVAFHGPVDAAVPEEVVTDVLAVVREALTNTARHADAAHAALTLTASGGELVIDVVDDGIGIGTTDRRSGLDNLRARAEQRGGTLILEPADSGGRPGREGTHLRWTTPLR